MTDSYIETMIGRAIEENKLKVEMAIKVKREELRDAFAQNAMAAIISKAAFLDTDDTDPLCDEIARAVALGAYGYADAMLWARNR